MAVRPMIKKLLIYQYVVFIMETGINLYIFMLVKPFTNLIVS